MTPSEKLSPDDLARTIAHFGRTLQDVLAASSSIAGRASEHLDGTHGAILFDDARKMIEKLREHPAMVSIASASVAPIVRSRRKVSS